MDFLTEDQPLYSWKYYYLTDNNGENNMTTWLTGKVLFRSKNDCIKDGYKNRPQHHKHTLLVITPIYSKYANYMKRVKSFESDFLFEHVKHLMSMAGFRLVDQGKAACWICSVELDDWTLDPISTHKELNPHCEYLKHLDSLYVDECVSSDSAYIGSSDSNDGV